MQAWLFDYRSPKRNSLEKNYSEIDKHAFHFAPSLVLSVMLLRECVTHREGCVFPLPRGSLLVYRLLEDRPSCASKLCLGNDVLAFAPSLACFGETRERLGTLESCHLLS